MKLVFKKHVNTDTISTSAKRSVMCYTASLSDLKLCSAKYVKKKSTKYLEPSTGCYVTFMTQQIFISFTHTHRGVFWKTPLIWNSNHNFPLFPNKIRLKQLLDCWKDVFLSNFKRKHDIFFKRFQRSKIVQRKKWSKKRRNFLFFFFLIWSKKTRKINGSCYWKRLQKRKRKNCRVGTPLSGEQQMRSHFPYKSAMGRSLIS